MTVIGIMRNPAEALAIAPVVIFAILDSLGKLEDEYCALFKDACTKPVAVRIFDFATCWRNALRDEK